MPLAYTAMASTVKVRTQVGIDERVAALRVQLMASEIALRFGQRLRQRRLEMGLKQPQLAALIAPYVPARAVDKQRVSDWERGVNLPEDDYKEAIVAATGVPDISYFYEPSEPLETPDPFAGNGQPEPPEQIGLLLELVTGLDDQVRKLRVELAARDVEAQKRLDEGVQTILASLPPPQS